jgi:hypothetical protein
MEHGFGVTANCTVVGTDSGVLTLLLMEYGFGVRKNPVSIY